MHVPMHSVKSRCICFQIFYSPLFPQMSPRLGMLPGGVEGGAEPSHLGALPLAPSSCRPMTQLNDSVMSVSDGN